MCDLVTGGKGSSDGGTGEATLLTRSASVAGMFQLCSTGA